MEGDWRVWWCVLVLVWVLVGIVECVGEQTSVLEDGVKSSILVESVVSQWKATKEYRSVVLGELEEVDEEEGSQLVSVLSSLPVPPGPSPPPLGWEECHNKGGVRMWPLYPMERRYEGEEWDGIFGLVENEGDGGIENGSILYELDGGLNGARLLSDLASWKRRKGARRGEEFHPLLSPSTQNPSSTLPLQVIVKVVGKQRKMKEGLWEGRVGSEERCNPIVLGEGIEKAWGRGCSNVVVNGIYASGSTLVFNILRSLRTLWHYDALRQGDGVVGVLRQRRWDKRDGDSGEVVVSESLESTARQCPASSRIRDVGIEGISKLHIPPRKLHADAASCMVVTFRDFRDSLCSHARREGDCLDCAYGSPKLEEKSMGMYQRLFEGDGWHDGLEEMMHNGALLLRYEDFAGPCLRPAIAHIAETIGIPISAEEVDAVVEVVDVKAKKKMLDMAEEVKQLQEERGEAGGMGVFHSYDPYNHIHANHASNKGASGVWKRCFSKSFQKLLVKDKRLGVQLKNWGYEPQPSHFPLPYAKEQVDVEKRSEVVVEGEAGKERGWWEWAKEWGDGEGGKSEGNSNLRPSTPTSTPSPYPTPSPTPSTYPTSPRQVAEVIRGFLEVGYELVAKTRDAKGEAVMYLTFLQQHRV